MGMNISGVKVWTQGTNPALILTSGIGDWDQQNISLTYTDPTPAGLVQNTVYTLVTGTRFGDVAAAFVSREQDILHFVQQP